MKKIIRRNETYRRAEWLRKNTHLTNTQAALALGVSRSAVHSTCEAFGIDLHNKYDPTTIWQTTTRDEKLAFIASYPDTLTANGLAEAMGCNSRTIRNFCHRQGIKLARQVPETRKKPAAGNPRQMDGFCNTLARLLSAPRLGLLE